MITSIPRSYYNNTVNGRPTYKLIYFYTLASIYYIDNKFYYNNNNINAFEIINNKRQ